MSTNTTTPENGIATEDETAGDEGTATEPNPFADEIAEVAPYARREGGVSVSETYLKAGHSPPVRRPDRAAPRPNRHHFVRLLRFADRRR